MQTLQPTVPGLLFETVTYPPSKCLRDETMAPMRAQGYYDPIAKTEEEDTLLASSALRSNDLSGAVSLDPNVEHGQY